MRLQGFKKEGVSLYQVADLGSGLSLPSTRKPGEVGVVQMKDLEDDVVDVEGVERIALEGIKDRYVLREGDLVMRTRGTTFTAALVEEMPRQTVLVSPLLRIRPDMARVLPEYLLWALNRGEGQAYLARHAKGTSVKMISPKVVREMPVSLPDLATQKELVNILNLWKQQQARRARIAKLEEMAFESRCARIVEGAVAT